MKRMEYVVIARKTSADQLPVDAKEVYRGPKKGEALKALDGALKDFSPEQGWWVGIAIEEGTPSGPTKTAMRAQVRTVRQALRAVEDDLTEATTKELSESVAVLIDMIKSKSEIPEQVE